MFLLTSIIINTTDGLKQCLSMYNDVTVQNDYAKESVKKAKIHVIQMIYCYYIHLSFDLRAVFSLVAVSLSILRRW